MLKDFVHIFVLSCKQATFLIEKKLHAPLSLSERCRLRMHLYLCKLCTAYNKKAIFLDKIMRHEIHKEQCRCQFHSEEVEKFRIKVKEGIKQREEN